MTIDALRSLAHDLSAKATVLAALNAELRARAGGAAIHPRARPHVDELLDRGGLRDALRDVTADEIRPLLAELRHFWLLTHEFMMQPERAPGWTHDESDTLSSGGEVTEGFPNALAGKIAPALDGLAAKLETGASFLDVGSGVGLLAMGMARRFPKLRVVGVDTWKPSVALAKDAVRAAGLADRIEIRDQPGEQITDTDAFDLAWVPAPFVSAEALPPLLSSVRRALRPGGWLLFVTTNPGDDLFGAALRFHVSMFGGENLEPPAIEALLRTAGFIEIRALPGPPGDFKRLFAARRA